METRKVAGIGMIVAAGGLAAYGIAKGKATPPGTECDVDADCPEGYICEHGLCIQAPIEGMATLWGIAINANSKLPISGIVVSADGQTRTTDTSGRYEFADMEPGTYVITISDPSDRYEVPSPMTITLSAGGVTQRNIELLLPAEYDINLRNMEVTSPIVADYPVIISCLATLCTGPVGVPKSRTVTLYVNGVAESTVTVTLTRTFLCAEQQLEFEYTPPSPGTYNIELDELAGSFEAVEAVFQNTGLELVENSRDSIPADATGTTKGFLECDAWLDDFYFTFNPTTVQLEQYECPYFERCEDGYHEKWLLGGKICIPDVIPNARFEGQIRFDYSKQSDYDYSNEDKTAKADHGGGSIGVTFGVLSIADYEEWLNKGKPLSDYGWAGLHQMKTAHSFRYSYNPGDWARPSVGSGAYDFSADGVLNLASGEWVVLACPSLSICYSREVSTRAGHVWRMRCSGKSYYKTYKVGTINV